MCRLNLWRWGAGVGGLLSLPAALGGRPGLANVTMHTDWGPRLLYNHSRHRGRRAQLTRHLTHLSLLLLLQVLILQRTISWP